MPTFTTPLPNKYRKLSDLVADAIDDQKSATADRGTVKPFIAGAVQGLGDFAADMSSPLQLNTIASPILRFPGGLNTIGRMGQEAAEASPMIGRRLKTAEKMFDVTDDAGRVLTNPGGYAGPKSAVSAAKLTKGTAEAMEKLKQIKTPLKTKIKPPRKLGQKGIDEK